jgi:hypothetical protein
MTTSFLSPISVADWDTKQSDLQIDLDLFVAHLKAEWPLTEIQVPPDKTNYILRWRLPPEMEGTSGLLGGIQSDRQVIALGEGIRKSFTGFVLWYRRFIPDKHALFLCNESSPDELCVSKQTSEDEIARFVGYI